MRAHPAAPPVQSDSNGSTQQRDGGSSAAHAGREGALHEHAVVGAGDLDVHVLVETAQI